MSSSNEDALNPSNQRLQGASRDFLIQVAKLDLPEGALTDQLPDSILEQKGLRKLIPAIAECIASHGDIAYTGNETLIEATRQTGPDSLQSQISSRIGDISMATENQEITTNAVMLRQALMKGHESLFDRFDQMLERIEKDKLREIDGLMDDLSGGRASQDMLPPEDPPPPPKHSSDWRRSMQSRSNPQVDDEYIRRAAHEFDDDMHTPDDDAIRESAKNGAPPEYVPTEDTRSEYEKEEASLGRDMSYHADLEAELTDIRAYRSLNRKLNAAFKATLSTSVDPIGQTLDK